MDAGRRIVIVGAGVIGCALAFELSRRGLAVTVVDARRRAGGATHASAGILAPYTEAHEGGALFDLTVRGLAVYDDFVQQVRDASAVPFEYARGGTLEIAENAGRADELRERLSSAWARAARLEWLDAQALRGMVPAIAASAEGALFCGVHGHVAVGAFTEAMADAAVRLGATFVDGARVERVSASASGVTVHAAGAAAIECDRVVLCAGSWTPEIDPDGATAGRIRPVRGQLVHLRAPDLLETSAVLWGRDCYIVPWTDGTLLVGATTEDVGYDERATASGVMGLLAAAMALLPKSSAATFLDVRVGLRPRSVTGVPLLGPGPDPRVLYAVGHYRNGVLLAPLTARLIADAILESRQDVAFIGT